MKYSRIDELRTSSTSTKVYKNMTESDIRHFIDLLEMENA